MSGIRIGHVMKVRETEVRNVSGGSEFTFKVSIEDGSVRNAMFEILKDRPVMVGLTESSDGLVVFGAGTCNIPSDLSFVKPLDKWVTEER